MLHISNIKIENMENIKTGNIANENTKILTQTICQFKNIHS